MIQRIPRRTDNLTSVDPRDPDCHWWDSPDGTMVWIDPDPVRDRVWRREVVAATGSQPAEAVERALWE